MSQSDVDEQVARAQVHNGGDGMLRYNANISQSGTDAPVPTVFENTLGFVPEFFYGQAGNYTIFNENLFPIGRTFVRISRGSTTAMIATAYTYEDGSTIGIESKTSPGNVYTNGLLGQSWLEIVIVPES